MTSRAVFLPHFGDPACLYYLLCWFASVWHEEVDAVYICSSNILNERHEQLIKDMVVSTSEQTGVPFYLKTALEPIQHGDAINILLGKVKEEHIMLMEEDTVVFKKSKINDCFKMIESGEVDAVGSSRASCGELVTEKSREKYGEYKKEKDGSYDHGYNFWPNFFFCKTDDLAKTDRNFGAMTWIPGSKIEQLDIVVEGEALTADTFGWASIQLRALGLKFAYVEQYHGHPDDPQHYVNRENVFDGKASWVHHGSLSGWRYLIEDVQITVDVDPNEIARRLQWHKEFIEQFEKGPGGALPGYCKKYRNGISELAAQFGISENQLCKRQLIYNKLFEGKI